jgi:hypothetical protein
MSVGVYIHDFEAMDQYLLNQGTPSSSSPPQLSAGASHAWGQLQAHHGGASAQPLPGAAKASKSEKYLQLGQKAERDGNLAVARLHYRVASRLGSKAAQDRLDEWETASSSTQIAGARR